MGKASQLHSTSTGIYSGHQSVGWHSIVTTGQCSCSMSSVVELGCPDQVFKVMFHRKKFFCALDLPSLLQDHLLGSRTSHPSLPDIYWKLLLLYPCAADMGDGDKNALYWVTSKLRFSPTPSVMEGGELFVSLSISSTPLSFPDPGGRNLRLCVRGMGAGAQGLDLEQRRQAIQGACSLAMFVPAPRNSTTPPQVGLTVGFRDGIVVISPLSFFLPPPPLCLSSLLIPSLPPSLPFLFIPA